MPNEQFNNCLKSLEITDTVWYNFFNVILCVCVRMFIKFLFETSSQIAVTWPQVTWKSRPQKMTIQSQKCYVRWTCNWPCGKLHHIAGRMCIDFPYHRHCKKCCKTLFTVLFCIQCKKKFWFTRCTVCTPHFQRCCHVIALCLLAWDSLLNNICYFEY